MQEVQSHEGTEGSGYNPGLEGKNEREQGGFMIEFPDGSTQRVRSRQEAIEAIQNWREQVH